MSNVRAGGGNKPLRAKVAALLEEASIVSAVN